MRGRVRSLSLLRQYGIVLFLVLLFIVLSLSTDTFLTSNNLQNVLNGSAGMGLIAIAGGLVIIGGGFDLSAGAIFTVCAVLGAQVSNATSPVVGILLALCAGCALGAFNGAVVTVGRINAFVATLGTSIAFAGIAVALTGSGTILIQDDSFANLASTTIVGIEMSTWLLLGVALLFGFLLNQTVFGLHVRSIGGNKAAARLSGLPVYRTVAITYMLSGTVAALAGMIVAARSMSITQTSGATIVFDALAAILIGGNSVFGGEGAIWRTLVGVGILALISNGFNLLSVDPLYQQIVTGAIILVAVGADAWSRRR